MASCDFFPDADGIRPYRYQDGVLHLLDQRRLPTEEVWLEYRDYQGVAEAIRTMVVRGAPAIGIAAAFGAWFGARDIRAEDFAGFWQEFEQLCAVLAATRPTAVNLCWALERMKSLVRANASQPPVNLKIALEYEALAIAEEDLRLNRAMGRHGEPLLADGARILTHCNAGALATGGYGTALGVIRAAIAAGKKISVLCRRDPPLAAGGAADRLGAAARRHPGHPDLRQHGRLADGQGGDRRRDRRRRPHRRQRRHRQQDRHLQRGGAGQGARHPLLRRRADLDHRPVPGRRRADPHRGARRARGDPRRRAAPGPRGRSRCATRPSMSPRHG